MVCQEFAESALSTINCIAKKFLLDQIFVLYSQKILLDKKFTQLSYPGVTDYFTE